MALLLARNARGLRAAARAPPQMEGLARMRHAGATELPPVKSVQSSPYAQTHTTSDVINFGLGQPSASLLPVDMFRSAAAHRFRDTQDPTMLQYGAAQGYAGFRGEIARFLKDTQAEPIDPDTLMVTAGNSQAISHAAMAFSKTNKRVFVEEPTYFLAHKIFRELGLDLRGVHVDKQGLDVDALEQQLLSGDVPAFLYTIPFFHNPTGAILPEERCQRLVALAQKYGFRIISDEPYNLLNLDGKPLPSLASYDDSGLVVSLGSFSKILAPGLRLGWAQSSKETIQTLATVGALASGGGQNPVTAALVHSVLEQDLLHPHVNHLRDVLRSRKAALCSALQEQCPELDFSEPAGGYFVWLHLPEGVQCDALLATAQTQHGVAFTPGTRCSLGRQFGDGDGGLPSHKLAPSSTNVVMSRCARLSFAFYEHDELREGVRRLQKALRVVADDVAAST